MSKWKRNNKSVYDESDDNLDRLLEEGESIGLKDPSKDSDELPSVLSTYLREISAYPLLSPSEERLMFQQYNDGRKAEKRLKTESASLTREQAKELKRLVTIGEKAKEKIIFANLRWVVKVARYYITENSDAMDVIQDGNLGLMKAVERFDLEKGFRFTTYSFWPIRLAITHGSGVQTTAITLPYHIMEKKNKIDSVSSALQMLWNRTPTKAEIANEMNISTRIVSSILGYAAKPISLDNTPSVTGCSTHRPSSGNSEFHPIEEVVDSGVNMFEEVCMSMAQEELTRAIESLDDRKRFILRRRFGFYDGTKWTLKRIGQSMGLTRERVRQLAVEALSEIREWDQYGTLQDYTGIE